MDIRKWLEETEQPEAPRETFRRKHPRRRSKSDSSFLEPLPLRTHSPRQETRDKSASEVLYLTSSDCSDDSQYARKPRRKTRPDRYEPSSRVHRGRKYEAKKAQRRTKRKKNGKPGEVVQNFKAKNVSGDRLTLKPQELGLFNKGKASMTVKGRGLPDLVFSEMKFLQKHKEPPEPTLQPDLLKRKRKKDKTHTKEGEISAFFTSVRPVLGEENGNSPPEAKRHHRDQASMIEAVVPTVEPDNRESYLGFGSRGPRHESTSYACWSDSNRAPSTTPARIQNDHGTPHNQRDSDPHHQRYCETDQENPFKRPALPLVAKQSADETAGRFKVSSLAPTNSRASRSQSYPQRTSSPLRPNLVDRSAKIQSTDAACSPSSMPPMVPPPISVDTHRGLPAIHLHNAKRETSPDSGEGLHLDSWQHETPEEYIDGEDDLETSSDLGRVLQECKHTLQEQHQAAISRRKHTERAEQAFLPPPVRQQHRTKPYPGTQRTPTVRFVDPPYQSRARPNFTGLSIYEQQAERRHLPRESFEDDDFEDETYAVQEDDIDEDGGLYSGEGDWDEMPEEQTLYDQEDREDDDDDVFNAGNLFAVNYVSEDPRPGNDVVAPGFWRPNKLY
ncbi:hypothetical protein TW65_06732 [Stemphylium lycopersici]|nr:hypothetical protein TW65_06732 [Stemphylium lycopersici]